MISSRPESNRRWSDSGSAHERRGLKHRGAGATRPVPIPPRLVQMLREHLSEFGTAPDGRLFQTRRGGILHAKFAATLPAAARWCAWRATSGEPRTSCRPEVHRVWTHCAAIARSGSSRSARRARCSLPPIPSSPKPDSVRRACSSGRTRGVARSSVTTHGSSTGPQYSLTELRSRGCRWQGQVHARQVVGHAVERVRAQGVRTG